MNEQITESGRHPINIVHLVFGLISALILGLYLAVEFGGLASESLRFLVPIPFVVAGAAGLVALAVNARKRPS